MTKLIVTLQGEKELLLADVIKGAAEKLMKEEGILGKAELLNQPELKVFPFMRKGAGNGK